MRYLLTLVLTLVASVAFLFLQGPLPYSYCGRGWSASSENLSEKHHCPPVATLGTLMTDPGKDDQANVLL